MHVRVVLDDCVTNHDNHETSYRIIPSFVNRKVPLVAGPGGDGVGEAVGVVRTVDDTLRIDTELPGGVDGGETVECN